MIKNYFLLLLLSAFAISSFAQQKAEFGFLLRGGNFGLPRSYKQSTETYEASDRQKAGAAYAFGFWHAVPVTERVRISWELLYQLSFRTQSHRFQNLMLPDPDALIIVPGNSEWLRNTTASSLYLPMKIEFQFRKNGKWSAFMGGGLSRILSWVDDETLHSTPIGLPAQKTSYRTRDRSGLRLLQTNLSAGLYYRFSPQTVLGAEYIFESARKNYSELFPEVLCACSCDCGLFSAYDAPKNMRSLSVSLRHNLLK